MTRLTIGITALVVVFGMLPIGAYHLAVGRLPAMSATEALELHRTSPETVHLVDIREPPEYIELHVTGAVNWPMEAIQTSKSLNDVPQGLRDGRLVLICDSGLYSASAYRALAKLGLHNAVLVRKGFAAFTVIDGVPLDEEGLAEILGGSGGLPYHRATLLEQWVLFLTGFVVKPVYMAVSLLLIIVLRRQRASDLAALRWGLIAFLAGEGFCAINYVLFGEESHLMEFLHSYGMVVAFGFMTYAFLEGMDTRIIKFSAADKRCAALTLCPACGKNTDEPCGLRRVFVFLAPAMIVVSLIPLCFSPLMVSYNSRILLNIYNSSHAAIYQIFESRYCPILAAMLFAASFGWLLRTKDPAVQGPKIGFSAGMGVIGFGLIRTALFAMFQDNLVWLNSWEEITELLLILAVAFVLYAFRGGLFTRPGTANEEAECASS